MKSIKDILQSKLLVISGKEQHEGDVIRVAVKKCFNGSSYLLDLMQQKAGDTLFPSRDFK